MLGIEAQERSVATKKALRKSRGRGLRVLSAKLRNVTYYRIITQILIMRKLGTKWDPGKFPLGRFEIQMTYSTSNWRNFNQQKTRMKHRPPWLSLYRQPEKKTDEIIESLWFGEVSSRFRCKVMVALAVTRYSLKINRESELVVGRCYGDR